MTIRDLIFFVAVGRIIRHKGIVAYSFKYPAGGEYQKDADQFIWVMSISAII